MKHWHNMSHNERLQSIRDYTGNLHEYSLDAQASMSGVQRFLQIRNYWWGQRTSIPDKTMLIDAEIRGRFKKRKPDLEERDQVFQGLLKLHHGEPKKPAKRETVEVRARVFLPVTEVMTQSVNA
ncbi:hypothetical protein [Flexibacterium corallicola]|uniref:hypothetical protein n=1 Tax=Flexibacterium corallicola TaxID=3037259 RepID=UPI00286ED2CC|nr:hypothetical protein [Pseudovibrio sp. M1P-2-3]